MPQEGPSDGPGGLMSGGPCGIGGQRPAAVTRLRGPSRIFDANPRSTAFVGSGDGRQIVVAFGFEVLLSDCEVVRLPAPNASVHGSKLVS